MVTDPVQFGFFDASSTQLAKYSPNDTQFMQQLREEMYRKNFELALRNKTLSTIRSLYQLTMESLDTEEISQKIADTIAQTLDVHAVIVSTTDIPLQCIRLLGISFGKTGFSSALPIKGRSIDMKDSNHPFVQALQQKNAFYVTDATTLLQYDSSVQKKGEGWKTIVIYPLFKKETPIGTLTLCFPKIREDISRGEEDTVIELLQLITLALDRARLYEALEEANIQLQELDKLKDEFVSLASHELRTPMAAIKGSLSTILEGYAGDISTEAREFLTAAYNENDRLIRLVNNLLNTSRIQSGKFSFSITRLDIGTLIAEVVKNLQMAAKEKNLNLSYEPAGFLPHVLADEDKIKEVVINLIGNATKFTSSGGITIQSKLDGNFVVTSVADTGTGIHKEHFELLFKKFSQLKTDYTKTIGGTGLGLYISKQIIEGQGGKIWLESEVGKGTTFYFSLPIAK